MVTSGLTWTNVDENSKFSFDVDLNAFSGMERGSHETCADRPCAGFQQMIINDQDGSVNPLVVSRPF